MNVSSLPFTDEETKAYTAEETAPRPSKLVPGQDRPQSPSLQSIPFSKDCPVPPHPIRWCRRIHGWLESWEHNSQGEIQRNLKEKNKTKQTCVLGSSNDKGQIGHMVKAGFIIHLILTVICTVSEVFLRQLHLHRVLDKHNRYAKHPLRHHWSKFPACRRHPSPPPSPTHRFSFGKALH